MLCEIVRIRPLGCIACAMPLVIFARKFFFVRRFVLSCAVARMYLCATNVTDMMEYIEVIVSFVVGGGLTTVLTGPSIKARARADAMKSMQDVYQEMITDLRNNNEANKREMNCEIASLHKKIDEQAGVIGTNTNEISRLNGVISHWVCYNDGCVKRNKQRPKKP